MAIERKQLPVLSAGGHHRPGDGTCLMELVSLLIGEQFTDHPRHIPRTLTALAIAVNDAIPGDAERTRWLAPLAPVIAAASPEPAVERFRAYLCADSVARRVMPVLLQALALPREASRLRSLATIHDATRAAEAAHLLGEVESLLSRDAATAVRASLFLVQEAGTVEPTVSASQAARSIRATAFALAMLGRAADRPALWAESASLIRQLALASEPYVPGARRPSLAAAEMRRRGAAVPTI